MNRKDFLIFSVSLMLMTILLALLKFDSAHFNRYLSLIFIICAILTLLALPRLIRNRKYIAVSIFALAGLIYVILAYLTIM